MANGLEGVSVRDQSETEITLDISNRGALIYRIAFTGIRRLKEEKEKKKKKTVAIEGLIIARSSSDLLRLENRCVTCTELLGRRALGD